MQLHKKKPVSKRRSSSKAFTLLEVMIATGILGCALIALLTTVNQSHQMNRKAVALLEQALLARTKIQEIMLIDNLSTSSSESGDFDNSPFCSYSYSTSEFELPFSNSALSSKESNILRIKLIINDKRTPNANYELTSYVFGKTR